MFGFFKNKKDPVVDIIDIFEYLKEHGSGGTIEYYDILPKLERMSELGLIAFSTPKYGILSATLMKGPIMTSIGYQITKRRFYKE